MKPVMWQEHCYRYQTVLNHHSLHLLSEPFLTISCSFLILHKSKLIPTCTKKYTYDKWHQSWILYTSKIWGMTVFLVLVAPSSHFHSHPTHLRGPLEEKACCHYHQGNSLWRRRAEIAFILTVGIFVWRESWLSCCSVSFYQDTIRERK